MNIKMVDLNGQYLKIKDEIDNEIQHIISTSQFIGGAKVKQFSFNLANYLGANNVVTCGNGTDALQIALMSLNLPKGSQVIVPAFTYVATAEVIALLGLVPVLVDVEWDTFNIDPLKIEEAITPATKAIVPVHLFGQCANMNVIMQIAQKHNLYVIEDNAQAIGAECIMGNKKVKSGVIGDIGCTSFFPSKNLGCFGDGGAIITNNSDLAQKLNCIANHGQMVKYHHCMVGCNSRLDGLQAAILDVKLKYLNEYIANRQEAAAFYKEELANVAEIELPSCADFSSHVYHQFTIKIRQRQGESLQSIMQRRDALKNYLAEKEIPSMVYYPLPLNKQQAYIPIALVAGGDKAQNRDDMLQNSVKLSNSVLSLPMHTELSQEQLYYICKSIKLYFK